MEVVLSLPVAVGGVSDLKHFPRHAHKLQTTIAHVSQMPTSRPSACCSFSLLMSMYTKNKAPNTPIKIPADWLEDSPFSVIYKRKS